MPCRSRPLVCGRVSIAELMSEPMSLMLDELLRDNVVGECVCCGRYTAFCVITAYTWLARAMLCRMCSTTKYV